MTALIAIALGLSVFLSLHYLTGGPVVGCGGGYSCDELLSSRWSAIGGVIPVSGLAAGTYLAMLLASGFIGPRVPAADRRIAWAAMLVLTGAAAGSAVWFVIVQKWIVGAFCPYCMAMHGMGVALAMLVVWKTPGKFDESDGSVKGGVKSEARSSKSEKHSKSNEVMTETGGALIRPFRFPISNLFPISNFGIRIWAFLGVCFAGILAISQVIFTPPAVYRTGEVRNDQPAIDAHAVPVLGSPDAPYVVTLLFDYNCPHCQRLHSMLEEAIRQYQGKIAFALCPSPLSTRCNPYVARDVDQFKNSCELAKLGLAVWKANGEALVEFDRWMFSFETGDRWHGRTPEAARAKAIELVGQEKLDAALADPWVDRYLQTCVRIYGDTLQIDNAIPKLAYGSRWVIPNPSNPDELMMLLQNKLAVPKP